MRRETAEKMVSAAQVRTVAALVGVTCLAWAVRGDADWSGWYGFESALWLSASAFEWYRLRQLRQQARREDGEVQR